MGEVILLSFHQYPEICTVVSMISDTHYLVPCVKEYGLPHTDINILFCLGFKNREIGLIGFLILKYSS
jgi:hypothetical protein